MKIIFEVEFIMNLKFWFLFIMEKVILLLEFDRLVFIVCICKIVVLGGVDFEIVFLYDEILNIGELLFIF